MLKYQLNDLKVSSSYVEILQRIISTGYRGQGLQMMELRRELQTKIGDTDTDPLSPAQHSANVSHNLNSTLAWKCPEM